MLHAYGVPFARVGCSWAIGICCGTSFPRNGRETFISILKVTSSLPSHNPPTPTLGFKSDLYGHLIESSRLWLVSTRVTGNLVARDLA